MRLRLRLRNKGKACEKNIIRIRDEGIMNIEEDEVVR